MELCFVLWLINDRRLDEQSLLRTLYYNDFHLLSAGHPCISHETLVVWRYTLWRNIQDTLYHVKNNGKVFLAQENISNVQSPFGNSKARPWDKWRNLW